MYQVLVKLIIHISNLNAKQSKSALIKAENKTVLNLTAIYFNELKLSKI